MKKQHRRWISLFLVLVFILNGIFLDVPELHQAASQFTFANHKVVFSDQDTILHASANILRNADFCIEDLLGIQSRDASSLRGVRDGRRSNAKVRVFLSLVHILDSKISYISEMADCTCIGNITFSCRTILRYIQRQDGKKPL